MVMGNLIDGSVIQPVKPFEINEDDRHDTFVFKNNTLNPAISYWVESEDWDDYCERYGIENTIAFSVGHQDLDPIHCDFFKINHKDYKYYGDLTIDGAIKSVFIKDVPELFDFIAYVGSTIKLLAQSFYREQKLNGAVEVGKVEGWGIGVDE